MMFKTKRILYAVLFVYSIFAIYLSGCLAFDFYGMSWTKARFTSIFDIWNIMIHKKGFRLKMFGAIAIAYAPVVAVLFSGRYLKKEELYGEARFSTEREIEKANLFKNDGLLLGKFNGRFLMAAGGEHALLYAPTGGGKGVGVVIPNLLTFDGSIIVTDLKEENYKITAHYRRATGSKVYLFSPGQVNTHQWNVFDYVDPKSNVRIDMIQKIAQLVCPNEEGSSSGAMWRTEARNMFIAASLYLMDTGKYVTLPAVKEFLKATSIEDIQSIVDSSLSLDKIAKHNFASFLKMGDKQQGGVLSEITSILSIFDNPLIASAVERSDFDLRKLKSEKTTIYLGCTPGSLEVMKPLLNLFFQFYISLNTMAVEVTDKSKKRYSTLLLIDEFTALGRMDLIRSAIAYLRGYNIRLYIIIQGLAQLERIYTAAGLREFVQNFKYRVAYAPNDQVDKENISKELGTKTVTSISRSRPTTLSLDLDKKTENISPSSRPLMLPDEVGLMPYGNELILVERMRPIYAEKIIYYEDEFFKGKYFSMVDPDSTKNRMYPHVPEVFKVQSISESNKVIDTQSSKNSLSSDIGNLVNGILNITDDTDDNTLSVITDALVEKYLSENIQFVPSTNNVEEWGFASN